MGTLGEFKAGLMTDLNDRLKLNKPLIKHDHAIFAETLNKFNNAKK